MRTTIDLPQKLLTKLKLKAVHEGVSFKTIYNRVLAREFGNAARPSASTTKRVRKTENKKR